MLQLAILLTSFNRKQKTLSCLKSVYDQQTKNPLKFTIFLVDDNSSDGTREAVKQEFPEVRITTGNGSLFWAGGMRTAWRTALAANIPFDYYFLLNDDTLLLPETFENILNDYALLNDKRSILIGSTKDATTGNFSYGGRILKNGYNSNSSIVQPNNTTPQLCHLGNANIMWVPKDVVEAIGILSDDYTHGIADYDYTMKAKKAGIPSYIGSSYYGLCSDDHGKNWKGHDHSLKERINYLYSPKGLAYKEYLSFIKKHFPLYLPQAWLFLWIKTFFPFIWELKK